MWRHIDYLCCLHNARPLHLLFISLSFQYSQLSINFYVKKSTFYSYPCIAGRQCTFFTLSFYETAIVGRFNIAKVKQFGGINAIKKSNGKQLYQLFYFQYEKKRLHRCFSLIFSPLFFHFYFLAVGGDVLMSRDYEEWLFVFENGSRRSLALYTFVEKDSLPLRVDIFYYICFFRSFFLLMIVTIDLSVKWALIIVPLFFSCSLCMYQFPGFIDKIRHIISFDLVLEKGLVEIRFTQGRSCDFQDDFYIFYVI